MGFGFKTEITIKLKPFRAEGRAKQLNKLRGQHRNGMGGFWGVSYKLIERNNVHPPFGFNLVSLGSLLANQRIQT